MADSEHKAAAPIARPILTERDYRGALDVARRLSETKGLDARDEWRLVALVRELRRFGQTAESAGQAGPGEGESPATSRRWTDPAAGAA